MDFGLPYMGRKRVQCFVLINTHLPILYFGGHFVPKEKVHRKLWIGADRQFKGIPANDREIQKKNRVSFFFVDFAYT